MARIDSYELADDDAEGTQATQHRKRDQDGVASLRDTEAEAGDDEEVTDDFDIDDREALEVGANLDDRDEPEPGFD
jgi:hypothetical protein